MSAEWTIRALHVPWALAVRDFPHANLWFSASISRLLLLPQPRLANLTFLASPCPVCAGMDPNKVHMSAVLIILVLSWLNVRIILTFQW